MCGSLGIAHNNPQLSHTSDLKVGTPDVHVRSVLTLAGLVSVYCEWDSKFDLKFYLSVATNQTVLADPSLRHTFHFAGETFDSTENKVKKTKQNKTKQKKTRRRRQ